MTRTAGRSAAGVLALTLCAAIGPTAGRSAAQADATAAALPVATATHPAEPAGDLRAARAPGATADDRPRWQPTGPVRRMAFLGDSLIADLRPLMPELAPNDVIADIERALRRGSDGLEVENLGRPGQSLVYVREDFRHHDPGITTLGAATATFFGRRPVDERPDLAVIATTGIDINVMAQMSIVALAPILVGAIEGAVADLAALGIDAVVLPIFPVSAEVLDRFNGVEGNTAERIEYVNGKLWDSGLPMLFPRFSGLDVDGVPGADPAFYARSPAEDPDDGIHPGPVGRRVYVDNVVGALRPLLSPPPPVPPQVHDA